MIPRNHRAGYLLMFVAFVSACATASLTGESVSETEQPWVANGNTQACGNLQHPCLAIGGPGENGCPPDMYCDRVTILENMPAQLLCQDKDKKTTCLTAADCPAFEGCYAFSAFAERKVCRTPDDQRAFLADLAASDAGDAARPDLCKGEGEGAKECVVDNVTASDPMCCACRGVYWMPRAGQEWQTAENGWAGDHQGEEGSTCGIALPAHLSLNQCWPGLDCRNNKCSQRCPGRRPGRC